MTGRFFWKVRRMLVMAPAEIGYRVVQTARNSVERLGFLQAGNSPKFLEVAQPSSWFSLDPPGVDAQAVRRAADSLMAGRWRVFAQPDAMLGFPPDWQQDPKTGKRVPAVKFGKAISAGAMTSMRRTFQKKRPVIIRTRSK